LSYSIAQRRIEAKAEANVKLNTRRFGELEFEESIVYHFANGLPGFEELRKFIVIDDKDTEPLRWLLSVDDPDIGFPVVELTQIAPELSSEISADQLGSSTTFVVVTLSHDSEPMSVNLKAPVILNKTTRTGRQVVLNSDKYSTKHVIN